MWLLGCLICAPPMPLEDGQVGQDQEEAVDFLFQSAPTLMFVAIVFHDAFGSPRKLDADSIFE